MKETELLILGGGHVALGLAMAQNNSLICEESEFVDAGFSLTLKNFSREMPTSLSAPGAELLSCYQRLGLLSDSRFHCGALEIGAAHFAIENNIPVMLKCRLVKLEQMETGYKALLITNAGLETIYARRIADTRPKGGAKSLSALFAVSDGESLSRVASSFPESRVEPTFCPQWGALHMPVAPQMDYNAALQQLHRRWYLPEKLALIAPRLTYASSQDTPTDSGFADPIAAFEAGYRWGKEAF